LVKGFDIAVGIIDLVHSTNSANTYEDKPRFETEVSYSYDFGGQPIYTWINGMHQATKDAAPCVSDVKSNGWLLQGSYSFWDKNKVALSYDKSCDKGQNQAGIVGQCADYSTGGIAYFYTVNDNFKLAAEYNRFKIDGRDNNNDDENTKTLAFGAVINW